MADAAGTPPRTLQEFLGLYRWDEAAMRDRLLLTLAAACLLGTWALNFAEPVRDGVLRVFGPHMSAALAAEAALARLAETNPGSPVRLAPQN